MAGTRKNTINETIKGVIKKYGTRNSPNLNFE
jgi:hypothetical protein